MATQVLPEMFEKMVDQKWGETCSTLLLSVSDSATPGFVAKKVVARVCGQKGAGAIKGGLSMLAKLIEEYGVDSIPLKTLIEGTKGFITNPNQLIRAAANSLFCLLYSYVGEPLKQLMGESKEPSMKSLISDFANVQLKAREEPRRQFPSANLRQSVDSALSRVNIASKLPAKLLAGLSDPGVKQRQEAKEQLEKILAASGPRIQPAGLAPLMAALKSRMAEPCKNLCRGFITILGNLASSPGRWMQTILQMRAARADGQLGRQTSLYPGRNYGLDEQIR